MDATRLNDGRIVVIKQVQTDSPEISIGVMLSTPESLDNPNNHCVPILDHFSNPEESEITYIVMPLLREFNDPKFYDISEMLDFVQQTLEVRELRIQDPIILSQKFYRGWCIYMSALWHTGK